MGRGVSPRSLVREDEVGTRDPQENKTLSGRRERRRKTKNTIRVCLIYYTSDLFPSIIEAF